MYMVVVRVSGVVRVNYTKKIKGVKWGLTVGATI